ncbi:hypothetical protein [Lactobacillus delbrueckii]|uniref:hypothetical protein n=1 Tax=Lactobacillus delbrueckii TaxID=1584 RepID=UPI003A893260
MTKQMKLLAKLKLISRLLRQSFCQLRKRLLMPKRHWKPIKKLLLMPKKLQKKLLPQTRQHKANWPA